MMKRMMMNEYLVLYENEWYIAHAGVAEINGIVKLCWCERGGKVICFYDDEYVVQKLPELKPWD